MGFSKRMIGKQMTFSYLINGDLKSLYNADSIIIMDDFSSFVRDLYLENKTEKEILEILNYKEDEMHQSDQGN